LSQGVIIAIAVVCTLVFLAAIGVAVVFLVPSIRKKIFPYKEREHYMFNTNDPNTV